MLRSQLDLLRDAERIVDLNAEVANSAFELRVPEAYGASRPLRRIPAIVSFLNPQPALSLVGGNRSSCPKPDLAAAAKDRPR